MEFHSDTEDDTTIKTRATHDHVLGVSSEALAKVIFILFRLVFKLILVYCSAYGEITKISDQGIRGLNQII